MRSASLLVACTIAACAREATDSADPSYTVADSAGVEIIESHSPAWADGGRRIEPEPLLRIGREEEGPYRFAFVRSGILLDDGTIVIGELATQEVRLFDGSGRHVMTFGGKGEGPGELTGLSGIFAYRGDSLAVEDARLYRTTIFSTSTGAHRTIRHGIDGSYEIFGEVHDSLFLLFSPGGGFRPDLEPGLQWVETDIVAMSAADGSTRVIGRLPDRERRVAPDGNAPMAVPNRYAIQAATRDGFYWATNDRYAIQLRDANGILRRIVRRPVEPRAVEASMIEQYIEAQLEWVRRMEGEGAVPRYRRSFEQDRYGEQVPLFSTAFVDRDQRLWIGESTWPAGEPPRRWSVFSSEGYWLGDVEAPDRVNLLDSRGDIVLGIWQNELDVPFVQLHRLVPARSVASANMDE